MDSDRLNSVLIIDDDKSNLEILIRILSPEYDVFVTRTGLTACEMASKFQPDIILLDIVMPDINGYDVLAALKKSEKTCHIPVIFITGLDSVKDEEKGLDMDAVDFIHKPFSAKIVKLRVRHQIQIVNQIRELVRLQKDLKNAVNDAEKANHSKSTFLARMSHEIRTPLNAILGLAAIELQNEALPAEVNDAFAKISNSGDLLLGIINDILDVSRIEAGKLELTPAEYDVASLINDTVYINIVKYEKKPIQFILNIDENIPKTLFGDEIRIKQILNNLLSNAFKYTDAGKIEFSVSAEETESDKEPGSITVVFRVRDTGQGITAEQMVRLFDEYSRFNKEANRETEGTGLGMNITMNLINLMNGAIVPESEPGRGSVFTVRLPQGKTGAPPLGKEAVGKLSHLQSISEPDTKKTHVERNLISSGKVLIVDDVEINIFIAKEMMSFYGLEIDSATSGPEAIEKIKNNSYNIVFMDHMMPVMDGIITTGEIRKLGQEYEKIPIIALTANAVSGMKEMFLANGFNGYLSKPIDMQELDSILKEWMPIR